MTNMIDYVKNVAKSVAYSVSDELSETAETSKSFVTTNKEVLSEIYSSMKDLRKLSKRAVSYIKKSKIYEAADEGVKAALEDIKTGKFYNKERIAKFEERALGSMMDFNDDDSGLDFDFDNADTSVDNDNDDMLKGFDDVEEAVVMSSRDNAAAVSTTIGKVGAASIAAGKANTMLLYDQQIKTNSIMEKGFSSIFDRLGQMNKVNTELVSTHADNSARFYESTTKLLQEQNVLLRQIVENQKLASGVTEKKKPTNSTITFNDVIGANGELNIKNYAKNIKQNLMNEMPSELKMLFGDSIGGEGSNILLTFASSPLQFITKFVAKSLIPSVTKQAVKEFDNTLSGAFSGILARFNKMANDQDNDSEISRILGRVFGVKTNRAQSINPKDYNKGQMPWNGIAQKSLTEVIPGYLRRIEALLSGEGERVYKWSEGKWETGRDFRKKFERLRDSDISTAYGDIKYQMSDLLKRTTYFSEEEWKNINKNMDAFLKVIVSQDYGNPRFKKGDEKKYYRYNVENDDIMKLLINAFQATSRSNRAQLSRKSYQAKNNIANRLNNILETNMELIEMFNGSDIDKGFTWERDGGRRTKAPGFLYNNAINKILDDHGHNVFWYLQRMYSEMVMFREAGYGGSSSGSGRSGGNSGGSRRRRPRNSHTPSPAPIPPSNNPSPSSGGRKIRTSRAITEARDLENRSPLYDSDRWMYTYLPDESLETQRIQRREQNRRAEYERGLKEAREKGLILYNSYDEAIISLINQRVNELSRESYGRKNYEEYVNSRDYKKNGTDNDTWINTAQSDARKNRREKINRIDQRIRESGKSDADKYGFFDRLLAAEDTSEKLAVFTNSIDNVLQAPQKFLTNIMLKADERLYNLVFGDGEVHMLNGKPVNSIMEEITFQIKDTFGKLNKWIDEKILTPFKDKGIHTIGDIFQKIGGMFGVDLKESFAKLKEGLKKKAKSVADSTREAAGAARDFVNGNNSNNRNQNAPRNTSSQVVGNGSILDLINAVQEAYDLGSSGTEEALNEILNMADLVYGNDFSIKDFDDLGKDGKIAIDNDFIKNFTATLNDQRFSNVKTRKAVNELSVRDRKELAQLLVDARNQEYLKDKNAKINHYTSLGIIGDSLKKYGVDLNTNKIIKGLAEGKIDINKLIRAKNIQEAAKNDQKDVSKVMTDRLEELNKMKNIIAPALVNKSISADDIMKYVSDNNASLDDTIKYIQESFIDNLPFDIFDKFIKNYKNTTGKDFDLSKIMAADENGEFDIDNNIDFSVFITELSKILPELDRRNRKNARVDFLNYLNSLGNDSIYNIKELQNALGLRIRLDPDGTVKGIGELQDILDAIKNEESIIPFMGSNARGTKYVTKTGITTIHEGEMIVPSELNPYNPNRGKVSKSTEIANENRVKNKFLRTLGKRIHSHSTGTYSFGTGSEMSGTIAEIIPDDAEHYQKFTDENGNTIYRLKIKGNEFWHEYKLSKQQMAENGLSLDPNVHDYPPKGMPSRKIDINVNNGQTRDIELVQDKVVRGWHNALKSAGMKEDYDKAMGAINKYGSAAAGGGLLGGGVGLGLSLLTGVAGGPIVGALVGAVGNIARKSDKVSNFLFGNIVDEETGERAGGLIDSEIQETFKKYAPSMSKMGIGGAIAGLVTPLGPLGGALIGSTLGFMKKNEDFQGLIFGEEGIFSEEDKTKFKKALPSIGLGAGVGALTGLLGGPFGLIGGALVGSAGGFLTTTNKFKDLVLGKEYDTGEKDEHGNSIMKRTGGVLGAVKKITIEPLKNGATYLKDHLKEFIDKDIVGPLKDGIKPVINMFKNGFETLKDTISNAINSVFEEKLGVPIGQFLKDKILNPLGKGAKTLLKLPFKMAGMAISAPFKLLGFVGNNIRANQIKKGKDLGSTAAERLAWREKHKIRSKKIFGSSEITTDGFIGNDGYKTVDENLLNLGDKDLSQLIDNIIAVQSYDSTMKGEKQDAIHSIRDLITPRFDTSEQIKIFSAVKSAANSGKGNYKKAFKTIVNIANSKGLPKEEIDALINNLEERLHEFDIINYADKKLTQDDRDELESQLRNLGFIKDKRVGLRGRQFDLKKIVAMLKSEKHGRIKDNTWSLSENGGPTQDSTTDAIRDQTNIQENISGNVKDIASNVNTIAEFIRKHNFAGVVDGDYAKNEDDKKKSEKSRGKLAGNLLRIDESAVEAKEKNKRINRGRISNNEENNNTEENPPEPIVNRAYGRFGGGSETAVVSQDELIVDPYSILAQGQLTDEEKELFGDTEFNILYNPLDDDETSQRKAKLRNRVRAINNAFLSGKTMAGKRISRENRMNLAAAIGKYYKYGDNIKKLNITDKSTEEEKENAKKLAEKQNTILSEIRAFMGFQTTDDGDVVKKLIDSKGNVYIDKHDPKNRLGLREGRTNNETNENVSFIRKALDNIHYGLFEKPMGKADENGNQALGVMGVLGNIGKKVLKFGLGSLLIGGLSSTIIKKLFGKNGEDVLKNAGDFFKNKVVPTVSDKVSDIASKIGPAIGTFFSDILPSVINQGFGLLIQGLVAATGWVGEHAGEVGSFVGNVLTNSAGTIIKGLPGFLAGVNEGIGNLTGLNGTGNRQDWKSQLLYKGFRNILTGNIITPTNLKLPTIPGRIFSWATNKYTKAANKIESAASSALRTNRYGYSDFLDNNTLRGGGTLGTLNDFGVNELYRQYNHEAVDSIMKSNAEVTKKQAKQMIKQSTENLNEEVVNQVSKITGKETGQVLKEGVGTNLATMTKKQYKQVVKGMILNTKAVGDPKASAAALKASIEGMSSSKLGGKIASALGVIANKLSQPSNMSTFKNVAGDAVAEGVETGLREASESTIKKGLKKASSSVLAKMSADASSWTPLTIVFSIWDLVSPIMFPTEAKQILGISVEPNFVQRVIAGVLNMIYNLIPFLSYLPISIAMDWLIDPDTGLLKDIPDIAGFIALKKQSKVLTEALKEETGLDISVDEYNRYINGEVSSTGLLNYILGTGKVSDARNQEIIRENLYKQGKDYSVDAYKDILEKYKNAQVSDDATTITFADGTTYITRYNENYGEIQQNQLNVAESTNEQIGMQTETIGTSNEILQNISNSISKLVTFFTGEGQDYSSYVSPNVNASALEEEYQNYINMGMSAEQAESILYQKYAVDTSETAASGSGRYSQRDTSINMRYNKPGDSIYQDINTSGCGPIAATNLINRHIKSGMGLVDPKDAANYAIRHGYKETNGGTDLRYFKNYFNSNGISSTITKDKVAMRKAIENGHQVVLMGKNSKYGSGATPYGPNPHYVVATGIKGSNIIVDNPEEFNEYTAYDAKDTLNQSTNAVITNSKFGMGTEPIVDFDKLSPYEQITIIKDLEKQTRNKNGIYFVEDYRSNTKSNSTSIIRDDLNSLPSGVSIINGNRIHTANSDTGFLGSKYETLQNALKDAYYEDYSLDDIMHRYVDITNKKLIESILTNTSNADIAAEILPSNFKSKVSDIDSFGDITSKFIRSLFNAIRSNYMAKVIEYGDYTHLGDKQPIKFLKSNLKAVNGIVNDLSLLFSNKAVGTATAANGVTSEIPAGQLEELFKDINNYNQPKTKTLSDGSVQTEGDFDNFAFTIGVKNGYDSTAIGETSFSTEENPDGLSEVDNTSAIINIILSTIQGLKALARNNMYLVAYDRVLSAMKKANLTPVEQFQIENDLLYIPHKIMTSNARKGLSGLQDVFFKFEDQNVNPFLSDKKDRVYRNTTDNPEYINVDSLYYNAKAVPLISLLDTHTHNETLSIEGDNERTSSTFLPWDDDNKFYTYLSGTDGSEYYKDDENKKVEARRFKTALTNSLNVLYGPQSSAAAGGNQYRYLHPKILIDLYKNLITDKRFDISSNSDSNNISIKSILGYYGRAYNSTYPNSIPYTSDFSVNSNTIKNNLLYTLFKVAKGVNPDADIDTPEKADKYYKSFNKDSNDLLSLSGALKIWSKDATNIEDFIGTNGNALSKNEVLARTIIDDIINNNYEESLNLFSMSENSSFKSKFRSLLQKTLNNNKYNESYDTINKNNTLGGHIFTKNDINYLKYIRDKALGSTVIDPYFIEQEKAGITLGELLNMGKYNSDSSLDTVRTFIDTVQKLETEANNDTLMTSFRNNMTSSRIGIWYEKGKKIKAIPYIVNILEYFNENIPKLIYTGVTTSSTASSSNQKDLKGNDMLPSGLDEIPAIAFEDLTVFSPLDASDINDYIARCYNANGATGSGNRPLAQKGYKFVECANKYSVNPRFVIAVIRKECSLGARAVEKNLLHYRYLNFTSIMRSDPPSSSLEDRMCNFAKSSYTIGSEKFGPCSGIDDMIENIFKFFAKISFGPSRLQKTVFALNYTKDLSYSGGSLNWLKEICDYMEAFENKNTKIQYIYPTAAQKAYYKSIEGKALDESKLPEQPEEVAESPLSKLSLALQKIAEGFWGKDIMDLALGRAATTEEASKLAYNYDLMGGSTTGVEDTFKLALTDENKNTGVYKYISSRLGPRYLTRSDGSKYVNYHAGVDIVSSAGEKTRIYSPISGVVTSVKTGFGNELDMSNPPSNGYGNQIMISDDLTGNYHLFAHLSNVDGNIKQGSEVKVGQYLGHIGNTGQSYGAHLHYGVMTPNPSNVLNVSPVFHKGYVPSSGVANDKLDWKDVPDTQLSEDHGWEDPDAYLTKYMEYQSDNLESNAQYLSDEINNETSGDTETETGEGSGTKSISDILITNGLNNKSSNNNIGGSERSFTLDKSSEKIIKNNLKNIKNRNIGGASINSSENTAELQTLKEITGILTSINNNTAKSNMFLAAFLKAVQNGEISTDSSMFSNMIKALSANSGLQTLASVGSTGNINKDLDDSTNTLINTMNTIARQ